ncbi:hypothetical protein C8R43DRAFT_1242678 [Mycena crocata]|nr:hypothetical protein C8R43DRAFT_1242678 [Mycena crocata]
MSTTAQSPAPEPPVLPNFAPIVTSQLIGSLLSFFFMGTLVIQVYVYRVCFPKDSIFLKLLVYFIFLMMLVCTYLNAADVENWFGFSFGDMSRFTHARYWRFYAPTMGSVIAMLVQLFFCYRILVIKRSAWPASVFIGLISMVQAAGGIGAGIMAYTTTNAKHDTTVIVLAQLWLIGGATADVLIAAAMTYLLLKAAVIPSTRDLAKDVVRLIIETNTFSAVVAIVGLVLFVGIKDNRYFICPAMILPGIYANTLLVTLNNRAIARLNSVSSTNNFVLSQSRASATCFKAPLTRNLTALPQPSRSAPPRAFVEEEREPEIMEVPIEVQDRNSIENQWREDMDTENNSYTHVEERGAEHV